MTSSKTSLPFYEVMPSFTSFGKKTLAVGHATHHCFQSTKLFRYAECPGSEDDTGPMNHLIL
ncbi:MAG: hypothetical protein V1689_07585 [Pseudomonadota bacterium]